MKWLKNIWYDAKYAHHLFAHRATKKKGFRRFLRDIKSLCGIFLDRGETRPGGWRWVDVPPARCHAPIESNSVKDENA